MKHTQNHLNHFIRLMRFKGLAPLIVAGYFFSVPVGSQAQPRDNESSGDESRKVQVFSIFKKLNTYYSLPTTWVKELKTIQAAAQKSQGELSAQTKTAIKTFSGLLPASPRTRVLRSQMESTYKALQTASDEDAPKLWSELGRIASRIDAEVSNQPFSNLLEPLSSPGAPRLNLGRAVSDSRLGTLSEPPVKSAVPGPVLRLIGNSDFDKLQPGDVILINSGSKWSWPWTRTYSHAGIYDGEKLVYETNYGDRLRHRSLDTYWKKEGCQIALGRIRGTNPEAITAALAWASKQWGEDKTPYNLRLWDKHRTDKLYCSQFVWQLFMKAATGVDVDSNSVSYVVWAAGRYGDWVVPLIENAVAPDEVRDSPHIEFYAEGIYSPSVP